MAKPYEKLSEQKKQYVDKIKKDAQSFNQLNKKNRELKSWLLYAKRRILIVSLNVEKNQAKYSQLERIIRDWGEEAVTRLRTLMEEYGVIKEVLDRQQMSVNMMYTANQTLRNPIVNQLLAKVGVNLSDAEKRFKEISQGIARTEEDIRRISIPNMLEDQKKIAEKVMGMFDKLIDGIDLIDILGKQCMRIILNTDASIFKLIWK